MATYYVPAIWKNSQNVITHLNTLLYHADGNYLDPAIKRTVAQVINMIEAGDILYTSKYLYNEKWQPRAKIHVVTLGFGKYLRSNHDKEEIDNLDNMIPMNMLGF